MANVIQPFRYWVQKALPLVYDDSLSYYELLCKLMEYVNNMATDVNTLAVDVESANEIVETANDTISAFITTAQGQIDDSIDEYEGDVNDAITALNTYRDNYFENLDLQTEVNTKLDTMASNGTLGAIMLTVLSPGMNHPVVVSSVDDMTSQTYLYILSSTGEVYQYNGSSFAGTGYIYGGVANPLNLQIEYQGLTLSDNLDNYDGDNRVYLIRPTGTRDSSFPNATITRIAILQVFNDSVSIVQLLRTDDDLWYREADLTGNWTTWVNVG